MKVININSTYLLTSAQLSFTESVINCGEEESCKENDSISILMNEIPIFLVNKILLPPWEYEDKDDKRPENQKPATEWMGIYTEDSLGYGNDNIPAIYLCPERIKAAVYTEEELLFLIAKVIIHEFAHAKMSSHPNAQTSLADPFFKWMEEPMANLITLQYFEKFHACHNRINKKSGNLYLSANHIGDPFDFVKKFIKSQPPNYRLSLDLFNSSIDEWQNWRSHKSLLGTVATKDYEKEYWIKYTSSYVGDCDPYILQVLLDALFSEVQFVKIGNPTFPRGLGDKLTQLNVGMIAVIEPWLEENGVKNFKVNPDWTIDVAGHVLLMGSGTTNFTSSKLAISINFGTIEGFFICVDTDLTEISVKKVCGSLICINNSKLKSLWPPETNKIVVNGDFVFYGNEEELTKEEVEEHCIVSGKIILEKPGQKF